MTGGKENGATGGIVVFSGGTAANSLVDVFNKILGKRGCPLQYIIPISDNGGSSSELIRVFGGPSVGDIRSRLVRLIPNNGDEERAALKTLFEYRLCSDPLKARTEWLDVVEGRHLLWSFISSEKRELIRSVFNTLNMEIVKRARPTSVFNFGEASIGNLFLTGARLFSGSFEASIYLLSMICSIPESISVLPAINSNFTHHISAGLADGTQIAGQVAISHPSAPTSVPDNTIRPTGDRTEDHDRIEDANLPGSLPVLRGRHAGFSKDDEDDLPAPVRRVWYINPYGHEIWPLANPKALAALHAARMVVYSIGSLYTSIVPSVVLRGVGAALADPGPGPGPGPGAIRHKVLVLNARLDRETGGGRHPMTATDFVAAIARAAAESQSDFSAAAHEDEYGRYVTHLVHLTGPGAPAVDAEELARLGVRCVEVRGRMVGEGRRRMLRYDEAGLMEALERITDE
ncbi:putative upf0052 domain protein [Phaeoacremonium minimum UCRPA7]|uniref:Putative upf0052 domain protein n=1 Tax=Phaeoacremonium minimum (strain UCR-PA7) TaxID=1286976 RepID=R8BTE1_PHAM7|nr:putative upf0052 domain protein [Phaeoacremonium minimum UCRPA7]EOO02616.1 putative upf0052 domain protein [Phaeoacremonium minimum UCRPA7]